MMIISKKDFRAEYLHLAIEKANNDKINNIICIETLYKDMVENFHNLTRESGIRVWYKEEDVMEDDDKLVDDTRRN